MSYDNILDELNLRLDKYQTVLKAADEEGISSKVRRYKRIVAQYENAIKQVKMGKIAPLDDLPNPPGFPSLTGNGKDLTSSALEIPQENDEELKPTSPQPSPIPAKKSSLVPAMVIDESPAVDEDSVIDKLTVRMNKYEEVLKAAEEEGNGAKSRRYKRIITQYKEALKNANAGKAIELSELPNPPGFASLVPPSSPLPSPQPSPIPERARLPPSSPDSNAPRAIPPQPTRPAPPLPQLHLSRAEKQTQLLKDRQQEYKDAAIAAKRANQIPEAKEYLKIFKGFDRLIQASEGGLPVDLSSIPVSLKSKSQIEESFYLVNEQDFAESSESDIFAMIKRELTEQIKSCMTRRNHFVATGDVANANRFEQWALTFKKDLNKIAMMQNSSSPIPKFHFEQKTFPVMQCFTDVSPGELELSIVRAVNLVKAADTYVSYEFPYPSDSPPTGYTSTVKDSSDPDYNTVIKFPIDRDSKPCQRIFKRHGVKMEVWAKGGFFHRDSSLGTVVVKLTPLNSEIMIHDAFDVMNGRRPTGAKLEIKIRLREPIVTKKIETISEKWLILD